MRNVATVLLILCAAVAWAQDGSGSETAASTGALPIELSSVTSVADLDLSTATLHQAGSSAFYLRSVGIDGEAYSLLFEIDAAGAWALSRLTPEAENILPADAILDFATVSSVDASTIAIDGVIVSGQIYSGSLAVGSDASLSVVGDVSSGTAASMNQVRLAAVQKLLSTDATDFAATVAEQQAELQEKIDNLEAERDAIVGLVHGLRDENDDLVEGNKTLSEQISDLQGQNQQLRAEVSTMTIEVDRLTELVTVAEEEAAEAETAAETTDATAAADEAAETDAPAAGVWEMPGDYLTKTDLDVVAEAVTAELRSLDSRIAALEVAAMNLASLEAEIRQGIQSGLPSPNGSTTQPGGLIGTAETAADEKPAKPAEEVAATDSDAEERVAEATEETARERLAASEAAENLANIKAELADLVLQNELLRREKEAIEQRILDEILERGFVSMMRDRLPDVVKTGFADSLADTGEWSVDRDRAVQMDPDQYFAKLAVSAPQASQPVLYSFRARSLDPDGWVGLGIHLFVNDVEKRRGYGMGRSLLVWLTRDPEVYKTNLTYLQLYRSDDDINMGRVMDSIIPEPVSEFLDIDVLYEPDTEYVTIAVNGVDKIRYQTWFGITSGIEIALRSLGRAEFRDLEIRTAPSTSALEPSFRFLMMP